MMEDDRRNKLETVVANLPTTRKLALRFLRKADLQEKVKRSGLMLMFWCALDLPTIERVLFGHNLP